MWKGFVVCGEPLSGFSAEKLSALWRFINVFLNEHCSENQVCGNWKSFVEYDLVQVSGWLSGVITLQLVLHVSSNTSC